MWRNNKIGALAELAWASTGNDMARAVRLLSEWTGMAPEFAFEAIDQIAAIDDVPPPESRDPIKNSDPL
jgi:hypothetical protein